MPSFALSLYALPPLRSLTLSLGIICSLVFIALTPHNALASDLSLPNNINDTQQGINTQQALLSQLEAEQQALQNQSNALSTKIIDKRVSIKQFELGIKRHTMRSDPSSTEIAAYRTAKYKLKVAQIGLDKLNKKQTLNAQQLSTLKTNYSAQVSSLTALSEHLSALKTQAHEAQLSQQKKKRKKKLAKKKRIASAKPKLLTPQEQRKLEHLQNQLRLQANASNSLVNTMLLNTQAIALVPISGNPNLGKAPQLKLKTNQQKTIKIGAMQHLGNSQYRIKTILQAGNNLFSLAGYKYKKRIEQRDNGKQAWLIVDARSINRPEFLLVKL